MSEQDAIALVFDRNAFYKRMHYLALGAFGLTLIVIIFLCWVLSFLIKNPTHPLYFATDNVGRLIQIVPVSKPNMTIEQVIDWTVEAVQATYSYDYVNYRSQLQNAQKYYTNYGWNKYMTALSASNNLIALTQRKMIIMAQVVEPPKIITQGLLSGAYAWKFEMPVLVTYWLPPYDDKSKFFNPLNVTVIVQRQSALQGYKGLGILQTIGQIVATQSTQPQEISTTPTG